MMLCSYYTRVVWFERAIEEEEPELAIDKSCCVLATARDSYKSQHGPLLSAATGDLVAVYGL